MVRISDLGLAGGSVVKTSPSNAEGAGLIPWWEAKILPASRPKKTKQNKKNIKQKQCCDKFNKDFFFNGPNQKIFFKKSDLI